jgi:hypothetical protein
MNDERGNFHSFLIDFLFANFQSSRSEQAIYLPFILRANCLRSLSTAGMKARKIFCIIKIINI